MTERTWDYINLVGSVVGLVGIAATAWRDWQEAKQARIRAQIDRLDFEKRRESTEAEHVEETPRWVEI